MEKRRCIAVANDDLRVTADQFVIDIRKQSDSAISAADEKNGFDTGIGDHLMQVFKPLFIRSGKIAVRGLNMLSELDTVAELLKISDAAMDLLRCLRCACRSDKGDGIAEV